MMENLTEEYPVSPSYNDDDVHPDYELADEISADFFFFAKYMTIYVQPIICCFGLVGNFLSFIIFLSKSMRKISSNLYLAALSVSSYGFNLVLLIQWLEMVKVPIMNMQGFCQALVYFGYIFSFLSVWLIVCITVENYIVTFHLSKAVIYCTVIRAKIVILCLVTYSVILYSGQFWTTRVYDIGVNGTRVFVCTESVEYSVLNRIYSFWDTITTLVLPFIITSSLIIAILSKNLLMVRKQDKASRDNSIIRRLSKKQKSLVRITRVLLAISLTYLILSGPSHANKLRHLIMMETESQPRYTLEDRILQQIFQIVYYISFCLNFVYYLIWSHNFRNESRRLFCLQQSRNRNFRKQKKFELCNGQNGAEKSTNFTEKVTML